MITGSIISGSMTSPIEGKMVGDRINFTANGRRYTGVVTDDQMEVITEDISNTRWSATRLEQL
jgi:hypothetical protein